ncbi:hypothetical protein J6590_107886 [Homalodisca vitripennis]|nr:hypothetical protein J6590_107886 [Homalodisca vitripennis]
MFGIYRYCSALPPLFLSACLDHPIEHKREELVPSPTLPAWQATRTASSSRSSALNATDNTISESITATVNEDVVPISHTTSGGESDGGPDEDLEAGQTFELDETALPPHQQQVKKSSQED